MSGRKTWHADCRRMSFGFLERQCHNTRSISAMICRLRSGDPGWDAFDGSTGRFLDRETKKSRTGSSPARLLFSICNGAIDRHQVTVREYRQSTSNEFEVQAASAC